MPRSDLPHWDTILAAVHAYYLSPNSRAAAALRQRCLEWSDGSELEQFGSPGEGQAAGGRARDARLAARGLLRVVLSHYAGIDFAAWRLAAGAHGKPAIAGPAGFESLRFNLTHTDGLVVCAVTRAGEIGVDVENTSRTVDVGSVARHFFSVSEQQWLASLPPEKRTDGFFEQWVLKEAFLKGRGTGLMESPESFTISRGEDGAPLDCQNWQFTLARPTAEHVAAIAIERRGSGAASVKWHAAFVGESEATLDSPLTRGPSSATGRTER